MRARTILRYSLQGAVIGTTAGGLENKVEIIQAGGIIESGGKGGEKRRGHNAAGIELEWNLEPGLHLLRQRSRNEVEGSAR